MAAAASTTSALGGPRVAVPFELAARIFEGITRAQAARLWFTAEALYSVTPTDQAAFTCDIIRRYVPQLDTKTLTEAGGGFGGNTMAFVGALGHVNYVDIKNAPIFRHNYAVLKGHVPDADADGGRRVSIHEADYAAIWADLKQDIVFMDPPWGGPEYKQYKTLKLFYGELNAADLAYKLLDDGRCELVLIKGPYNFRVTAKKPYHVEEFPLWACDAANRPTRRMLYKIVAISRNAPANKQLPVPKCFAPVGYRAVLGKK